MILYSSHSVFLSCSWTITSPRQLLTPRKRYVRPCLPSSPCTVGSRANGTPKTPHPVSLVIGRSSQASLRIRKGARATGGMDLRMFSPLKELPPWSQRSQGLPHTSAMMSLSCWRTLSLGHQGSRLWAMRDMLAPQIRRCTTGPNWIMPPHSTGDTLERQYDPSVLV